MQRSDSGQLLGGKRILVVDDEFLIAVTIEDTLIEAGAEIFSAATLPAALQIAEHESLSAAVLDFQLGAQTSEAAAAALAARGIPFVFYSGQNLPDTVRERFPAARVMAKPLRQEAILLALTELMGSS